MDTFTLLNARDVKQMLKVSIGLVYRMADEGRIPCIYIDCPGVGRQKKRLLRFKYDDIVKFVDAHYRR